VSSTSSDQTHGYHSGGSSSNIINNNNEQTSATDAIDHSPTADPVVCVVRSKQERESAIRRGSKVIPCRARGMPMDHSGHTAFFEITKGMAHGSHLICSHAVCRDSGVKFLYCAVCDMPVARRSFRSQHLHGKDRDGIAATSSKTAKTASSGNAKRSKPSLSLDRASSSSSLASSEPQVASRKEEEGLDQGKARKRLRVADQDTKGRDGSANGPGIQNVLVQAAVARMDERNANEHISSGEEEVEGRHAITSGTSDISTSDNQSVDQEGGDSSDPREGNAVIGGSVAVAAAKAHGVDTAAVVASENDRIRARWLRLLSERRRLRTDEDMSSWLIRVLEVSEPYRRRGNVVSAEETSNRTFDAAAEQEETNSESDADVEMKDVQESGTETSSSDEANMCNMGGGKSLPSSSSFLEAPEKLLPAEEASESVVCAPVVLTSLKDKEVGENDAFSAFTDSKGSEQQHEQYQGTLVKVQTKDDNAVDAIDT